MAHHSHDDHSAGAQAHYDEAGLADLLDLDAAVLGSYLHEVTEWLARYAPDAPRSIVDIGAGTGTGSLALAHRFPSAQLIAIDRSAFMLERLEAAAQRPELAGRLRAVQADVDAAWPEVGTVDIAWAVSSLHEFADPDRVLRDVYAALRPGGVLAVIEMDTLPRFLPDDIGLGRPGLESRCHEVLARAGGNAHPNWRPYLERAGFEIAEEHGFTIGEGPLPPDTGRYADAYLRRIRPALEGKMTDDDLSTLDQLLAADGPEALAKRGDLTLVGSRTAWAARRP